MTAFAHALALTMLAACGPDGAAPPDGGGMGRQDGGRSAADGPVTRRDAGDVPPPPADWCTRGDTELGRLASSLAPRSFVEMPPSASLGALEMGYSLLYWSDSAVWDATRRQVHWIGGPGSCCADPPDYQRLSYDVATDTWSIEATPFSASGHSYDANAIHPATGAHFFALLGEPVVHVLEGGTWSMLPEVPVPAATTPSLAWFAGLGGGAGGLAYASGWGRIAWFDGTAWNELDGAHAEPWGSYNTFVEVNERQNALWVGGGNEAEQVHYRMDADGTLTRLADAPFSISHAQALHAYEPASGRFLVFRDADDSFHEYDIATDTWTALTDLDGAPDLGESRFQVPIPDCNVVLFFDHYYDQRRVFLYRHL